MIEIALSSLALGRKGLSPEYGAVLAQAASVCLLEQGHRQPTNLDVSGTHDMQASLAWTIPTEEAKRTWNDEQYATEHGAYCIAALLVESRGLEIIERSRKKTGFDFWLGDLGSTDPLFQGKSRLEVSGLRNADRSTVESRVKQKINQTKVSDGTLPAIIVVVEFGTPRARMEDRCKA